MACPAGNLRPPSALRYPPAANAISTNTPEAKAVASGTLLDASGQPTAGYVGLMARPLPARASDSVPSAFPLVDWLPTGSNGSYAITQSEVTNSPAAAKLRALEINGVMNFALEGETSSGTAELVFGRILQNGAWSPTQVDPGRHGALHIMWALPAGAVYPPPQTVPNDPPPVCYEKDVSLAYHPFRVGRPRTRHCR